MRTHTNNSQDSEQHLLQAYYTHNRRRTNADTQPHVANMFIHRDKRDVKSFVSCGALAWRAITLQKHRHTHTCRRMKRMKATHSSCLPDAISDTATENASTGAPSNNIATKVRRACRILEIIAVRRDDYTDMKHATTQHIRLHKTCTMYYKHINNSVCLCL